MKLNRIKRCQCGCGQIILIKGRKFINLHQNRGKNNPRYNMESWNHGLTKYDHKGIMSQSKKIIGNKNSFYGIRKLGKDNPSFIDGRSKKIQEWKNKVFERDRYKCQNPNCKKKYTELHAHHIKPRKEFPELIYDIDNGITWCDRCHVSHHKKGLKMSEEQKQKISNSIIGRKDSEKVKRKKSLARKRWWKNHTH
jgi:hypothetical protein